MTNNGIKMRAKWLKYYISSGKKKELKKNHKSDTNYIYVGITIIFGLQIS